MARSRAQSKAKEAMDKRRNPQGSKQQRKPEPSAPATLDYSPTEINTVLFPVGQKMTLSTGDKIHIKPWSIKMFGEMAQRIPDTMAAAMPDEDGNTIESSEMAGLFVDLVDEVVAMVALTIDWDEERIREEMPFEELVAVATVVWDVCIMGPMGKIGGLMGRVMGTVGGVTLPAAAPMSPNQSPPPSSLPPNT
jgi:hypothetical protein